MSDADDVATVKPSKSVKLLMPPKPSESIERAKSAIQSLSRIIGPIPDYLSSSDDPALALLQDSSVASTISLRLCQPNSGAGDDNICRWFYDTFQSTDSSLQLSVLRFLPIIAGMYLSRCTAHRQHRPLSGFEAVLLALYAHETMARDGKPLSINLPNVSAPNPYSDARAVNAKGSKNVEEPNVGIAVISAMLEPHGTIRSTKRARIVSVALELYHSKISQIPLESKLEFCRFTMKWAGHYASSEEEEEENEEKKEEDSGDEGERIPIPWELLSPALRILGHCLLGQANGAEELKAMALAAVKALHRRAMHDMNAQAILAARSVMRVGILGDDTIYDPPMASVYSNETNTELDLATIPL